MLKLVVKKKESMNNWGISKRNYEKKSKSQMEMLKMLKMKN